MWVATVTVFRQDSVRGERFQSREVVEIDDVSHLVTRAARRRPEVLRIERDERVMPHLFETGPIVRQGPVEDDIFDEFFNRGVGFTQGVMKAGSCYRRCRVLNVTKTERFVLESGERLARAGIDM